MFYFCEAGRLSILGLTCLNQAYKFFIGFVFG